MSSTGLPNIFLRRLNHTEISKLTSSLRTELLTEANQNPQQRIEHLARVLGLVNKLLDSGWSKEELRHFIQAAINNDSP